MPYTRRQRHIKPLARSTESRLWSFSHHRGHLTTRRRAAMALGEALLHLIVPFERGAALRACVAHHSANSACVLVTGRFAKHETGARAAHLGTVEQDGDVARILVPLALAEAVRHRPQAGVMTPFAFLNAPLHLARHTSILCPVVSRHPSKQT